MENVYFALTEAFNRDAPTVALASGQAVVYYRIAIMSKDGDWVIRESPDACECVRCLLQSPRIQAMQMLSEDDRNLTELTHEELALAWDLWFDLSQSTNDYDPPYAHGVFVGKVRPPIPPSGDTSAHE